MSDEEEQLRAEHCLVALNAMLKVRRIALMDEDLNAEQYVEAFKEIEEQAMIARMAMQRVVDIERGAQ